MSLGARLHYSSENFDYWGIFTYNIELTENATKFTVSQKVLVSKNNKPSREVEFMLAPVDSQQKVFNSNPALNFQKLTCSIPAGNYEEPYVCGETGPNTFYIPRENVDKKITFQNTLTEATTRNFPVTQNFEITVPAIGAVLPPINPVTNLTRKDVPEKDSLRFTFQDSNSFGPIPTYFVEISTNAANSSFASLPDYLTNDIKIPIEAITNVISEDAYNLPGRIRVAVKGKYGEAGPWTYSEPFIMPSKDLTAKEEKTSLSVINADNPYTYIEFDKAPNHFFQMQYGISPTSSDDYYGVSHSKQAYFENNNDESFIYSNIKDESELVDKLKRFDNNTKIIMRYRTLNKDKKLARKWHYQPVKADNVRLFPQFFVRLEDNQSMKAIYLREE